MSKLETNQVDPASGTTLTLGTSGDTVTVPTGVGLTATDEVKSNKLSPATGTALQIGDSGDTITIPSGATIANSGTATGFGGNMSPMFSATLSGNQTVSDATVTKVSFNSEDYDTDGCYDTSNYRFTPTTAGKYLIITQVMVYDSNGRLYNNASYLKKNGSTIAEGAFDLRLSSGYGYIADLNIIKVVEMNGSSDYLEMFAYIDGTGTLQYQASNSYFQGYKIIE